jgi:heme/copper-type cytochrome/quinol oxidase subunit 2
VNASPTRLPIIAWTCALLALAAAWGAMITDTPWNILLVLLAVLGIVAATATFAIWFARVKAEADQDENGPRRE